MLVAAAESSVSVPVPPIVYLLALLKVILPTVFAASTVTARGAVMAEPKIATFPGAFGCAPRDQLVSVDQVPSELTFHTSASIENLKLSNHISAGAPPPGLSCMPNWSQPPPSGLALARTTSL